MSRVRGGEEVVRCLERVEDVERVTKGMATGTEPDGLRCSTRGLGGGEVCSTLEE